MEAVPQKSSESEKDEKKNIDCEKEHKEEKTGSQEVYEWKGLEDEEKGSQDGSEGGGVGSWGGVGEILTVTSTAFEAQVVVVP